MSSNFYFLDDCPTRDAFSKLILFERLLNDSVSLLKKENLKKTFSLSKRFKTKFISGSATACSSSVS